jgi:adenylate cyclase
MEVLETLNVKLIAGASGTSLSASLKSYRPSNLRAYESYLKGVNHFFRRTRQDSIIARQLFEESIALDPNFGAAYKNLGFAYLDEVWFRITPSPEKSIEQAEKAAQRFIDLSPDQPPPYGLLSHISLLKKKFDDAGSYGEKAGQASRKGSRGDYTLGRALGYAGRYEESIVNYEIALRLVPLRPLTYVNGLAWSYLGNEQYDKAIPLWTEALERNPEYLIAFQGLTAAYELLGNKEKATWAAENVLRINPKFSVIVEEEMFILQDAAFKKRLFNAYRSAGLK